MQLGSDDEPGWAGLLGRQSPSKAMEFAAALVARGDPGASRRTHPDGASAKSKAASASTRAPAVT